MNAFVKLRQKISPYLFLVPCLIVFGLFLFYPFAKTIYLSLYKTDKLGQAKLFVGFGNYIDLFTSESFYNSLLVTLIFVVIVVMVSMLLGLVTALLVNKNFPGIRVFSTAYALPMAIASSAAALIFEIMLDPTIGILDKFLRSDINWLHDERYALVCVALLTAWLNSGINYLYFSAGLANIDESIYERASVDGANEWQKFTRLTLPGLSPILFYTVIVNIILAFQSFGQVKILTEGGPGESTNLIVYSIYRDAFFNFRFGGAAALVCGTVFDCHAADIAHVPSGKEGSEVLMDIRLEPRTAAHPKREEIERLHETMKKRELGRKRRRLWSRFGVNLVVSVLVILPLLYALSIAFMPSGELFSMEMNLIPKQPTLDNFAQAFTKIPLFRFILNSFLVAGCITLGQIIFCSLAAFALSFLDFKGKNVIFMLIMATMMVPGEATIISNYLTVSGWGWLNSYKVLIIPYITSAMGIFLFRQFYLTFPKSLYEAAKIDGCPNLVFIVRILIPLTKSAIGAMAVYTFINAYNMYMWPLLVTGTEEMRTVQIGISMLNSVDSQSITMVIAGVVMVILPSLFVFILGQKQLIRGMFSGAVKG